MVKCPSCETDLDEDFGLVTCSNCGVVCFIDLEGNALIQEASTDQNFEVSLSPTNSIDEGSEESIEDNPLQDFENINSTQDPAFQTAGFDPESNFDSSAGDLDESEVLESEGYLNSDDNDLSSENYILDEDESSPSDDQFESFSAESDDFSEPLSRTSNPGAEDALTTNDSSQDAADDEVAFLSEETQDEKASFETQNPEEEMNSEPEQQATSAMSAADFFSEMEVFGSMDSEPFQEGTYFFDIEISGIDSVDVRKEVLETLEDGRLDLEDRELTKKIRQGVLRLEQIQAVKAAIIVQNLSQLNCDLDWHLKEVQDLESPEEIDESEYQEQGDELEEDFDNEQVSLNDEDY